MQLRYAFRLYPDTGQQTALAKAFGCARVVFNDAVYARESARKAGKPFLNIGELSTRLITQAKQTEERSWLGEVSAVVLQQSLRDAETAYRNFFASLKGTRKGPRTGAPRFKARKDTRQSIRFTANARWSVTGSGRLNLPKVGAVKVKWSAACPRSPPRSPWSRTRPDGTSPPSVRHQVAPFKWGQPTERRYTGCSSDQFPWSVPRSACVAGNGGV